MMRKTGAPTRAVGAALALAGLCAGCVTLPQAPAERALYFDLRSVVDTETRIDWVIDAREIEEASSAIMTSACQATEDTRLSLSGWLSTRLADEGGSARQVYEASGGDLSEAREALVLERVSAALRYADDHYSECPFWLKPDPDFRGVQSNTDRFVIFAESMGSGQMIIQDGETALGGSGLGRLIPAWGISDRVTLGIGAELGVASTFPRTENGARSLKAVAAGGIPVLLRVLDGTFRYDVDVAGVAQATRNEYEGVRYGGRVGVGFGLATLRIASAMPYAMIWAGYEYLAPGAGESESHIIRAGSRVGINWDP